MIENCRQEEGKYEACVKYANLGSHGFDRLKPLRLYLRWVCFLSSLTEAKESGRVQPLMHNRKEKYLVDLPTASMYW